MKKSARIFFEKLLRNNIKRIVDIRLNNTSQLAGFTKRDDLRYFLEAIGNIEYVHLEKHAPTKELLNAYKKKFINWEEYENRYIDILEKRNVLEDIDYSIFNDACLLCSEPTADQCHRRLLAEYLAKQNNQIEIIHL